MNHLSLLLALTFRLIIIVLILIIGTFSLSETIINIGISIIRAMDKQEWLIRAMN
jgi:hypothetical protein